MQKFFKSELGRSMVEMLGVLALVGVLSIAAMAGYSYAVTKWKANETLSEIGQRAMEESLFLMKPSTEAVLGMALPETDFGPTSSLGYAVQAFVSEVNEDYFEIVLQNIPSNVCAQLVRDDEISIGIFVGETLASGEPSLCGEEETAPEMSFVFRSDLSRFNNCSKRGYFDLTDLSCHCSGNTYIDSETNECLCPAGYIWHEGEKTCKQSNCAEGFFETRTEGCKPCSNDEIYIASAEQCSFCEDRVHDTSGNVCAPIDTCTKGEEFPYLAAGSFRSCISCTKEADYFSGSLNGWGGQWCLACLGRHYTSYGACVVTNQCIPGQQVRYLTAGGSNSGCVNQCDSVDALNIGSGSHEKALCEACVNSSGQKNRKVVDGKCIKVVCDEGEFKGADGKCYRCSQAGAVSIGTDAALLASCEAESCGREATANGLCQIKNCDKGSAVRTESGACFTCTQESGFYTHTSATQEACLACSPARHLTSTNYCVLTGRCNGFSGSDGAYCFSCSDGRSLKIGTGSVEVKECEENCLDKRIALASGYCALKSCTEKTQFMGSTGSCYDCSYVTSVEVGPDDYTQALCRACDQYPRFVINNICYRCNTDETPDVTTDAEKSSCALCTERTLSADGKKCILKQ